jgi:hypothetical protein
MTEIALERQEFKFLINRSDAVRLKDVLASVMDRDRHSDQSGSYVVSSLYFETSDNKDLEEKLDGIHSRKKFRIRIYNKQTDIIKFETKLKHNTVIEKKSLSISTDFCQQLVDHDYSAGDSDLSMSDNVQYLKAFNYMPRVITEYKRTALSLPFNEIRITFDEGLSSYHNYVDILNLEDQYSYEVYGGEIVCLEVKYTDFLPTVVRDMLSSLPAIRASVSKYCLSQRYIDQSNWSDVLVPPF